MITNTASIATTNELTPRIVHTPVGYVQSGAKIPRSQSYSDLVAGGRHGRLVTLTFSPALNRYQANSVRGFLWWFDDAFLACDSLVKLGPPVAIKVEQRFLEVFTLVQITTSGDDLVSGGCCLGHDLPAWGNDARLGQRLDAGFDATLGYANDPGSVLVSTCLHTQMIVEALQRVLARIGCVVNRRVIANHDQLYTLQTHLAIRLWPASIVTCRHSNNAVEGSMDAEPFVGLFEVAALKMLKRAPWLVVFVARYVDLAVFANNGAVTLDEHRRVKPVLQTIGV